MKFKRIPCVYYPTTVMMVDDNLSFLENIRTSISDYMNIRLFSNAETALLELLNAHSSLDDLDLNMDVDHDELDFENATFIDYQKLFTLLNNNHEFSVVIIDYSMPEINGIEFCKKIKSINVKKLMLTGEADNQIAVDAFNEGLIDKFLVKSGSNMNDVLNNYIDELKIEYFLSSKVNVTTVGAKLLQEDIQYIQVVNDWIKTKGITKFYKIDSDGNLCGYDKNNKSHNFRLVSDKLLYGYVDIARQQGCPVNLLKQLLSRIKIPVFITNNDMKLTVDKWSTILYKPDGFFKLDNHNYYYCFC